jgi:uncharacterized phage protein (TIGR02218 family)
MTYDASESGINTGQPVDLYRFTRGLTIWTYTSADVAILFNDETYFPVTISRGNLPQNDEATNATLNVTCDSTLDLVADFISGSSPSPTSLTLIRRHRNEASVTEQAIQFQGQVGVVEFGDREARMVCVPIQKAIQRKIPRILYQTVCNHMLYDQFCTVNPAGFTFAGHISAIVGLVLTVPEAASKPDGYYNGGWVKDGETFAFIQTHVGTQLTLMATSPKLVVGDVITTTAGCDRLRGTCVTKFNNLENFMGFPYIPTKNPYGDGGLT